jgi:hypothetical protein
LKFSSGQCRIKTEHVLVNATGRELAVEVLAGATYKLPIDATAFICSRSPLEIRLEVEERRSGPLLLRPGLGEQLAEVGGGTQRPALHLLLAPRGSTVWGGHEAMSRHPTHCHQVVISSLWAVVNRTGRVIQIKETSCELAR